MKVWVTDDWDYSAMQITVRETVRDVIPENAVRVNLVPRKGGWRLEQKVVGAANCHVSEQAAREFCEKRRASKIEALRREIQEWEEKKVEVIE